MSKKFVIITVMVLLLVSLATFEVLYAKETIQNIDDELKQIQTNISVTMKENGDSGEILTSTSNLLDYWNKRESVLCLMFNHNDMKDLGKEITETKAYLEKENLEEAYIHSELAILQIESLRHILQINFQNIL